MSEMILINRNLQVKCLSKLFEVVIVEDDCDYAAICESHQPDLAVFEMLSGAEHLTSRGPKITNLGSERGVPRLGFLNADSFCEARAGFISDMDRLGIEAAFSICTTAAEHTPELANRLFTWPNFIDPELFRDYGGNKIVPILISGSQISMYPWRRRINKLVTEYYPSLICPHRGYEVEYGRTQVLVGESYARTISASWFVPTCGTVANEVVRKHFEIPACGACLISEWSPGLEAAGFVDMVNCVLADKSDILDKLEYLFANPDELNKITREGYELVHSRHTINNRSQILQWYKLRRRLQATETIIQLGPFQQLTVVSKTSGVGSRHVFGRGIHLSLVREGDAKLLDGRWEEAEHLYRACLNYIPWMPEPKLRLAICCLLRGDALRALSWIREPLDYIICTYRAADPDPVEWAYLIIIDLCLGNIDDAVKHANSFTCLRHVELARARWIVDKLTKSEHFGPPLSDEGEVGRCSIHRLPSTRLEEWVKQIRRMLIATGQTMFAQILSGVDCDEKGPFSAARENWDISEHQSRWTSGHNNEAAAMEAGLNPNAALLPATPSSAYSRALSRVRRKIANSLHDCERRIGYFLPYHLSEMRSDEFLGAIRALTVTEEIGRALLVGAARGQGPTEAFLAGTLSNAYKPSVYCVNNANRKFLKLKSEFSRNPRVNFIDGQFRSQDDPSVSIGNDMFGKDSEHFGVSFDAVLIDASELSYKTTEHRGLIYRIRGAKLIFLDDINTPFNYDNCSALVSDPAYHLVAHNPNLRDGYAIFQRSSQRTEGKFEAIPRAAA